MDFEGLQIEKVLSCSDVEELAVFSCKVGGRVICYMWDTGATICLISTDLVRKLGLWSEKYTLDKPRTIIGLGDARVIATEGILLNMQFDDGKERPMECVITDIVPHDLLLGLPFMKKYAVSFNPEGDDGYSLKLRDGTLLAKTCEAPSTAINSVFLAMANEPDIGITSDAGPEVKISKNNSKLHPDLQSAFNCHLASEVNADTLLDKLLASGDYVIDDAGSDAKAFETIDKHQAYYASKCFSAEEEKLPPGVIKWDLSNSQKKRLDKLLADYNDIFANSASDVGSANFAPVRINLLKKAPIACKNYRTPLQFRGWLKEELKNLLKAGIIEESESPWNSPTLVVPKKLDVGQDQHQGDVTTSQGCRLVIDYRRVNEILEDADFPIPRIQDLLMDMHGCDVFSAMDIRHAFFTIELHPDSRTVTAFSCEFGKYQFRFLPQGLKISPAVFQQKIHSTLAAYQHSDAYIDDINTHTKGVDQHFQDLEDVFKAMRKANFKLKKSKCLFFCKQLPIVGRVISADGISIDPDKLKDLDNLRPPTTVAEVRALLGFTGYLRDHVEHYNDISGPIQALVSLGNNRANTNIEAFWDEKCKKSLELLVLALKDNKVLKFPELGEPYELFTDASGKHMSGVLTQLERPVGYFARSFKGTQKHWAALTKEAYAVYRSVEFFSVFITGSKVLLRCDHKPLERFLKVDTRNQMVNRWSVNMQQYNITFKWVPTDKNISDCLSRLIKADLYEPHEEVLDDFTQYPKLSTVYVAEAVETLVVKSESLSEAVQLKDPMLSTVCVAEAAETLLVKSESLPKAIQLKDMKALQEASPYCSRIKELMMTCKKTNLNFMLKDQMLYKIVKEGEVIVACALVLPMNLALTAIVSVHLELLHPGETKMINALKTRVYWKGMSRQVRQFVRGCPTCQLKALKKDQYSFKHDNPPLKPWQRLAIDIAGSGYGETADGHIAVVTAMCLHSQYPFAEPVKDKTSSSVIKAMTKVLSFVNTCTSVLSDNGPEFRSAEFEEYLAARDIKHEFTAPYCPQSNGTLERFHRYMNNIVRMIATFRESNDWETSVDAALTAYRSIPHSSSGLSPHELAFGSTPVLNLDKLMPTLVRSYGKPSEGELTRDKMNIAFGVARKNLCLSRKRNVNNKSTTPDDTIKVGDMVTMRVNAATKSQSPWKMGFRVLKYVGDRTVQIEHVEKGNKYRVSVNHLKKTEPLAILLENSNLDVIPGWSKLYLPASDMPDLNWPEPGDCPDIDDYVYDKILEAVRDRSGDKESQDPPKFVSSVDDASPVTSDPLATDRHNLERIASETEKAAEKANKEAEKLVVRTRSGRVSKPNRNSDFVYMSHNLLSTEQPSKSQVFVIQHAKPVRVNPNTKTGKAPANNK